MISRRYSHYVFVAIMAMSMTLVLTLFATLGKQGLSGQFIFHWLNATARGFVIAFPAALVVTPAARWFAEKLTMRNES